MKKTAQAGKKGPKRRQMGRARKDRRLAQAMPGGLGASGRRAMNELIDIIAKGPQWPNLPPSNANQNTVAEYKYATEEAQNAYLGLLDAAGAWGTVLGTDSLKNGVVKVLSGGCTRKWERARLLLPRKLRKVLNKSTSYGECSAVAMDSSDNADMVTCLIGLGKRIEVLKGLRDLPDEDIDYGGRRSFDLKTAQEMASDVDCPTIVNLLATAGTETERAQCFTVWFVIPRCLDVLGWNEQQKPDESTTATQESNNEATPADAGAGAARDEDGPPVIAAKFEEIRWRGKTLDFGRSMKKRLVLAFLLKRKQEKGESKFKWKMLRVEYNKANERHQIESEDLMNGVFKGKRAAVQLMFERVDPRSQEWRFLLPVPPGWQYEPFG